MLLKFMSFRTNGVGAIFGEHSPITLYVIGVSSNL